MQDYPYAWECLLFFTAQCIDKVRAETVKPCTELRQDVSNEQNSNIDNETVRSYSSTLK